MVRVRPKEVVPPPPAACKIVPAPSRVPPPLIVRVALVPRVRVLAEATERVPLMVKALTVEPKLSVTVPLMTKFWKVVATVPPMVLVAPDIVTVPELLVKVPVLLQSPVTVTLAEASGFIMPLVPIDTSL